MEIEAIKFVPSFRSTLFGSQDDRGNEGQGRFSIVQPRAKKAAGEEISRRIDPLEYFQLRTSPKAQLLNVKAKLKSVADQNRTQSPWGGGSDRSGDSDQSPDYPSNLTSGFPSLANLNEKLRQKLVEQGQCTRDRQPEFIKKKAVEATEAKLVRQTDYTRFTKDLEADVVPGIRQFKSMVNSIPEKYMYRTHKN